MPEPEKLEQEVNESPENVPVPAPESEPTPEPNSGCAGCLKAIGILFLAVVLFAAFAILCAYLGWTGPLLILFQLVYLILYIPVFLFV